MVWQNKFRKFLIHTLRVDIMTAFLTLIIFSFIAIISFTYVKDSKMIINFAEDFMEKVSDLAINETKSLLNDAQEASEIGAQLVNFLDDIKLENEDLLDFMFATLKYNQYFENYYFGAVNGDFVMVSRLPTDPNKLMELEEKPPPKSFFRVRFVKRSTNQPTGTWVYYDKFGNKIGKRVFKNTTYDPRTRPWYRDIGDRSSDWAEFYSRGSEEFVYPKKPAFWTNIYVFETLHKSGISVSDPAFGLKGEFLGMFGTDLSLDGLSDFLTKQKIGENGREIIITEKGEVVAAPELPEEKKRLGLKVKPTIKNIRNQVANAAYTSYQTHKKDYFVFEWEKEKYLASYNHFPKTFEKDWVVLITAPLSDFLGTVLRNHTQVLIISIVILVLSIFAVIILARRISKPIVKLAHEIDEIKQFHLDNKIQIPSNIKEIIQITDATISMQTAIKSFSYFVPKELVQKLIIHGEALNLGGRSKKLTMFFSDIQDFTTICENLPAEQLMIYLSDYLDAVSKIIIDLQGTIDKYIGDNVMAFWGAPDEDPDNAFHGCSAALRVHHELSQLNNEWKKQNRPTFFSRIGVHKAEVVVGNIGTHERRNYTIIGDGVNLTSRLEPLNRYYNTHIIISHDVYVEVKDKFLTRTLDLVAVKGKKIETKIYELVGQYNAEASLSPTPEQVKFCETFNQGFELYHQRKWQQAKDIFAGLLQQNPEDEPSKLYLAKCDEFLQKPPPDDWDGVFKIEMK